MYSYAIALEEIRDRACSLQDLVFTAKVNNFNF